jgi:hypothetical protein
MMADVDVEYRILMSRLVRPGSITPMFDHHPDRSSIIDGLAIVVEVRRTERGDDEVVLDAQFDGDPFLTTLRHEPDELIDLSPGRLVRVRRLASGEIELTTGQTGVPSGAEPV